MGRQKNWAIGLCSRGTNTPNQRGIVRGSAAVEPTAFRPLIRFINSCLHFPLSRSGSLSLCNRKAGTLGNRRRRHVSGSGRVSVTRPSELTGAYLASAHNEGRNENFFLYLFVSQNQIQICLPSFFSASLILLLLFFTSRLVKT